MKNIKNIIAAIVMIVSFASCSVTTPYAVTSHPVGAKKGVSKTTVLFGNLHLNGNYGIAEAAKKGKIKGPVSTVDLKITQYFSYIFYTMELIVTGDAE